MIKRREFLQASAMCLGAFAFGSAFWRDALAAPATAGPGPYGPLQAPDANGIALPQGFKSRVVAEGGKTVPGTSYNWHVFSDGQGTYRTPDGGFILVSNSENPPDLGASFGERTGGASSIRFSADGTITDAYRILSGTAVNCAGGVTPWGTWLSCEEHGQGQVWECDPTGQKAAVARPALGIFDHEAVCVDPDGKALYLSEDQAQGGFYRFRPDKYPDLSSGTLEIAQVGAGGLVNWLKVPDPSAAETEVRGQVEGMTQFRRGEGIWFDSGVVYLCTTADAKIHTYDTKTGRMDVLYDSARFEVPPLTNVDNVTISRSGDLFVCEDTAYSGDPGMDIGIITPDRQVTRFLKVTGNQHTGVAGDARSELAGVVFDPSGDRLFFASQRAFGTGVIYEITGPFRPKPPVENGDGGKDGTHGFRVYVPPRVTSRTLLERGLPFSIVTSKPLDLSAKMTSDLPSSGGSRRTTIARVSRELEKSGRYKLYLRPKGSTRSDVARERSFSARVTIVATDPAGVRRVIKRSVRVARRFGDG